MAEDLRRRRAALEQEWTRCVPARARSTAVRTDVAESWRRSLITVDPATDAAPATPGTDGIWATSPLRAPVTGLADELRDIAEDAGFVAAVTDPAGTILWTCGGRVRRRRAEQVNFAPSGRWGEADMGTNALSLALRTRRPASVFSAEHLVAALHGWVCYCAPIRDTTGTPLGVLDLSTTWDRAHPLAMSTVRALARTIESRLAPRLTVAAAGIRLTCLGIRPAALLHDGVPARLRPRQLEILALLALEPAGFTPERLRAALYGDRPVTATTLKAEVSHVRAALDGGVTARRYALTTPMSCDATDVLAALASGDRDTAVRAYTGPLLPESDAPGIEEWRTHIDVGVRDAVLTGTDPAHALAFGAHHPYDTQIHHHALRLLGPTDPRRGIALARLER